MPYAHIIGLGKSGITAARLLKYKGWQVTISDRNTSDPLLEQQRTLISEGIPVDLGQPFDPDAAIASKQALELVVVSPGVPWDVPSLVRARELGIETIGEIELAWRSLRSVPWVGITGTNGKTTTTALTAAIFREAGLCAPACGNIGYAACDLALKVLQGQHPESQTEFPQLGWVIAELSSYQLESSRSIAPRIGIWTTFTPDHLNRHRTLERYFAIKAQLLTRSEIQVLNGDDPYLARKASEHWPEAYWISTRGKAHLPANSTPGAVIEDNWIVALGEPITPIASLPMFGSHNQQNLLLAVTAARLAGIEIEAIAQAIAKFPGVPHRLEKICTWQDIDFINDSKATNYDAAQVGLAAIDSPVILIAGGEVKVGDDSSWMKTIQDKAAAVLLIGSAAPLFKQRLTQAHYPHTEIVETLDRAVPRAAELAQQYQARAVLLSPACASFDQYQNFEHRGDHFRQLCSSLPQC